MDWLCFREPVNTWTHFLWMLLAVPATLLLWQRSRGDRPKQVSLLIFGIGLIVCFGGSALYHGIQLPPEQLEPFVTLDHIGIYLLIAGTCTGIAFTLVRGPWKWCFLVGTWLATVVGITSRLLITETPRWLNPCIYLAIGWTLASCHPKLVRAVSRRPVRLVWLGGYCYSLGAVFLLIRWPVLWPGVIGAHEVLHLFVMAGSLAHFWFVLKYVAPYPRTLPMPANNLSAQRTEPLPAQVLAPCRIGC